MKILRLTSINNWIIIICYISLFCSITNLIPGSVSFVLLLLIFPYLFVRKERWSGLQKVLLCIYIYFFLSALIYDAKALITPNFYRRDGNFFATFLPLLILTDTGLDFSVKKVTECFLVFESVVNVLCLILFYSGNQSLLFRGISLVSGDLYHFLFIAHNAAGGFLSCVLAISAGFLVNEKGLKKLLFLFCTLSNLIGVWASDSRGTIIAVLVALCLVFIKNIEFKGKKHTVYLDLLLIVLLLAVVFIIEVYIYKVWGTNAINSELRTSIEAQMDNLFGMMQRRPHTIFDRALRLWPIAIMYFLSSPIVGCGFGSYNDGYYVHSYADGIFAWNYPPEYMHSDAHAHQSFLNIMAETGIVGLVLIFILLHNIKKEINNIEDKSISMGLYLAFVMDIISSFTEHRLFTPSQMIPFILILAMSLSKGCNRKKKESDLEVSI